MGFFRPGRFLFIIRLRGSGFKRKSLFCASPDRKTVLNSILGHGDASIELSGGATKGLRFSTTNSIRRYWRKSRQSSVRRSEGSERISRAQPLAFNTRVLLPFCRLIAVLCVARRERSPLASSFGLKFRQRSSRGISAERAKPRTLRRARRRVKKQSRLKSLRHSPFDSFFYFILLYLIPLFFNIETFTVSELIFNVKHNVSEN